MRNYNMGRFCSPLILPRDYAIYYFAYKKREQ